MALSSSWKKELTWKLGEARAHAPPRALTSPALLSLGERREKDVEASS
jgi:hypothetical protein